MSITARLQSVLFAFAFLSWAGLLDADETTASLWRELGAGSASGNGISNETLANVGAPAATLDAGNGNVFVAWESGDSEIFVRKWTGSEWVQVGGDSASGGGVSNNAGRSRFPSIAVGPDHAPVVAWLDNSSGHWEVYLRKFNPTSNSWAGIAGSADAGGVSRASGAIAHSEGALPVVSLGSQGHIFVAWAKNATERHVFVSALSSTGWNVLGGTVDIPSAEYPAATAGTVAPEFRGASRPSLVVGGEAAPIVAYVTESSTSVGDVHVRRWNGSAWLPFGLGSASNAGISGVGPRSLDGYSLSVPRLAIAPNGQVHASWLYSDSEHKLIHVRRVTDTGWIDAGPALAVPNAHPAGGAAFGFNGEGSALVAWTATTPVLSPLGNTEVHLRRLVRTTTAAAVWQEFGAGSATGGGISANSGESAFPFLAFSRTATGGAPVIAWLDGSDASEPLAAQIYVRRALPATATVEFVQPNFGGSEAAGSATIGVIRKGSLSGEIRVRYASRDGTATAGADYTAVEGDLVFGPNEATKTFAVEIARDDAVESGETVALALSNPSAGVDLGANRHATLVISDSAPPPPPPNTAGIFRFRVASFVVGEGGGRAVIDVTRVEGSTGEVSVDFETAAVAGGHPATAEADYTAVSGTLVFADGVTSRAFEVPILEDTLVEGREIAGLRLSKPTGAAVLGTLANASLVIEDNDHAIVSAIQFDPAEYHVAENGGVARLRVSRSGEATAAASVEYFTPEMSIAQTGVATPGADFDVVAGTLTFAIGESTKTIEVPIRPDTLIEPNEFFRVGLRNPQGATIGRASSAHVVIVQAPTTHPGFVVFGATEFRVMEGGGVAEIAVVRREGSTGEISVSYSTGDVPGTEHVATADLDYTSTSGVLTFANGETRKTFTVPILDDTATESYEVLSLTLTGPSNTSTTATAAGARAALVIADDDQPAGTLQFGGDHHRVREGAEGITLIVTRREGGAGEVTVNFATADVTARAGSDYTATTGTLTFAPGQLSRAIRIPIRDDSSTEGPETFTVALSTPTGGALLGTPATVAVTIVDRELAGVLQFSRAEFGVGENDRFATITVKRGEGAAGEVTVNCATADGAALAGEDYSAASGTLTFPPGVKSRTFTVAMIDDAQPEPRESLTLLLSDPTGGAALGPRNMATLTIADNDAAPKLQFSVADFRVRENGEPATISVVRRGSSSRAVTVKFATGDGTAIEGDDYTAVSGVLEFAPGQTVKRFRVPVTRDTLAEGAETVQLTLSEPTGGAILGTPGSATLTIIDPSAEHGSVQFAAARFHVNEAAGTATIFVTRQAGSEGAISVKYSASAGTAAESDDFTPVSGTLNFAAREREKSFTVPIVADDIAEAPETVLLDLTEPTGGALLGTPARAVLYIVEQTTTDTGIE